MAKEKWIQKALAGPKSKGKLHRALHVKQNEKIPKSKIEKAAHSKSPKLAKEAHLAETLGKLRKKK